MAIKGFRGQNPEDIDFAAEMLSRGEGVDAVRTQLVGRGLAPSAAERVIEQARFQSVFNDAIAMTNAGMPLGKVKEEVVRKGERPRRAETPVDPLNTPQTSGPSVRKVVGGVVIA